MRSRRPPGQRSAIAATMPRASASPACSKRTGPGRRSRGPRFSPAASIRSLGRFNLGTADPNAPDATVRVRGLGLRISTPDGQEWRSAMIDAPVFPVSTPQAFYELLLASASKDPNAMKTFRRRASRVRGVRRLGQERALDRQLRGGAVQQPQQLRLRRQFRRRACGALVAAAGGASRSPVSPDDLAKRGPDFLEQEITERVAAAPQRWTMVVTVANPGDPTADPSKAWPDRSPHRRGRHAHGAADRSRARTARAATSTSIRPSCRPASGHRTTRSRPRGRPPMRSRTTVARRRPRTIREPRREPSHDRRPPTLHRAAAPAALAHGGLHPGHAVHRRGHGVHRHAEISDARFDPQTARHRHSGARADPPGGAPALRRAAAAGRPARADEARGRICRITRSMP